MVLPRDEPIPASFDFAGRFAGSPFCLFSPRNVNGAVLLAGWVRLVSAFAQAMGSNIGNTGEWGDANFAANWLTVRAYDDWLWTRGEQRTPISLVVPFDDTRLTIFRMNSSIGGTYLDWVSLGSPP